MTLDEIAKLAGVSKTTASYVINGKAQKYRISEKTQQKVMAVVEVQLPAGPCCVSIACR